MSESFKEDSRLVTKEDQERSGGLFISSPRGIFLEEKLGFDLTPEQEDELRKLWQKDKGAQGKGF